MVWHIMWYFVFFLLNFCVFCVSKWNEAEHHYSLLRNKNMLFGFTFSNIVKCAKCTKMYIHRIDYNCHNFWHTEITDNVTAESLDAACYQISEKSVDDDWSIMGVVPQRFPLSTRTDILEWTLEMIVIDTLFVLHMGISLQNSCVWQW